MGGLEITTNLDIENGEMVVISSSSIAKFKKELPGEMNKGTKGPIEKAEKTAKDSHRYTTRTGVLSASTKITMEQGSGDLLTTVDGYIAEAAHYGKYIVWGHQSWAPDKFVQESLETNGPTIDRAMNDVMDKELEKLLKGRDRETVWKI